MIVVIDPDPAFRTRVSEATGRPDGLLEAESIADSDEHIAVHRDAIDVVVIGPDVPSADAVSYAEELSGIAVVLVSRRPTATLLRRAMRAGVGDVLATSASTDELRAAVLHATERVRKAAVPPAPSEPGRITVVFGTKGGCGRSVVASNLAVLLARAPTSRVALVDLDLESGDLPVMLRVFPVRTVLEATAEADHLDADAMAGYLTPAPGRVHLLAPPPEPGMGEKIGTPEVKLVLELLAARFTHVVVDCPAAFSDQVLAALDAADRCVLVAGMDVPSIKGAKLAMRTLQLLGWSRDKVSVVLNRSDSRVGFGEAEAAKALGTEPDVSIPSTVQVTISVNRGVPIVLSEPHSPVSTALTTLASRVSGAEVPDAPAKTPLLRRFKKEATA